MFSISNPAVQLYKEELDLQAGDGLQLFVRYAGTGIGFCLGVEKGLPQDGDYVQEIEGIRFFVKPHEVWFVDQMKMDCDDSGENFSIDLPSIA
ncbi:HesB/YadR/YfhF family protein [Pseudalkalibacillus decolorationis]|uniref:HesB/YadR/YfhF family protein n=1 Tax=Pseudalkalibacillus decolorationis TaxID=163879 RepID=UPI0021493759|nr:iron-sulfur cluster biosynthesis family protein [Pseudalkalibacillus decolorationis]